MKISIRKPIGYSQIGRKDQQEDAVWPLFSEVSSNNPCVVLCDGVGGSEHGEIASQTSSKVIGEYLTKILKDNHTVSDADLHEAVNLAYDELEKIDTEASDEGAVSMATTLTCVCIHNDGILAAHMGDSRIYHVRPGQGLLYQSADHSLVNTLLQAGEITLEEAKNFPRKNVITKAIQPHGRKRFKAEVQHLTDIQTGDYIFLCCDGVLEQLTNERLVEILSMKCSDKEKLSLLEAESTDKTKDNYTAYLIPIEKVIGVSSIEQEDEIATVVVENAKPNAATPSAPKPSPTPEPAKTRPAIVPPIKKSNNKILIATLTVIVLGLVFFIGRCTINDADKSEKKDSSIENLFKPVNKSSQRLSQPQDIPEDNTYDVLSSKSNESEEENDEREPVTTPVDNIKQIEQN